MQQQSDETTAVALERPRTDGTCRCTDCTDNSESAIPDVSSDAFLSELCTDIIYNQEEEIKFMVSSVSVISMGDCSNTRRGCSSAPQLFRVGAPVLL